MNNWTRGVEDVLIAVVDGLKGFQRPSPAVFPQTHVRIYIVHLIRNSRDFIPYKAREDVAASLKRIYQAKDAAAGADELEHLHQKPINQEDARRSPVLAKPFEQGASRSTPFPTKSIR